MKVSREDSFNKDMRNLQLQLPNDSTELYEDVECSDSSEEDGIDDVEQKENDVSLKSEFENEHELDTGSEKPDKLTSKSVSFVVRETSEQFKPQKTRSTRSGPRRKISNRHSVPAANFTRKVVPVLDTPSSHVSHGQRLHPSSALKIYALAKTRQRSASGRSLVSRAQKKQCNSFVKHNTSEMSIVEDFAMNDGVDRDIGRISKTFVDIPYDARRMPMTNVDRQSDEVVTKDKERRKEKKDLVNWCINALSEKAKYPVFSPKPRLRSRRSELRDEGRRFFANHIYCSKLVEKSGNIVS